MDQPAISRCKHLRTKMAHVMNESEPEGWREEGRTSSTYWCLRTMLTTGPDDRLATPERCQPERPCFSSPDVV